MLCAKHVPATRFFWRVRPTTSADEPWKTCYPVHSFLGTTEPEAITDVDIGPVAADGTIQPGQIQIQVTPPVKNKAFYEFRAATSDVQCTDVFERGGLRSIYLRDPDGHVLEIATPAG